MWRSESQQTAWIYITASQKNEHNIVLQQKVYVVLIVPTKMIYVSLSKAAVQYVWVPILIPRWCSKNTLKDFFFSTLN